MRPPFLIYFVFVSAAQLSSVFCAIAVAKRTCTAKKYSEILYSIASPVSSHLADRFFVKLGNH